MEIRQDDPTAPHVADLLAHHLQELQSVMAEALLHNSPERGFTRGLL